MVLPAGGIGRGADTCGNIGAAVLGCVCVGSAAAYVFCRVESTSFALRQAWLCSVGTEVTTSGCVGSSKLSSMLVFITSQSASNALKSLMEKIISTTVPAPIDLDYFYSWESCQRVIYWLLSYLGNSSS